MSLHSGIVCRKAHEVGETPCVLIRRIGCLYFNGVENGHMEHAKHRTLMGDSHAHLYSKSGARTPHEFPRDSRPIKRRAGPACSAPAHIPKARENCRSDNELRPSCRVLRRDMGFAE